MTCLPYYHSVKRRRPAYNGHYCNIKAKVDDFFIRCRLAAFDPQSTQTLNLQVARVETITDKDLSGCLDEIAAYPLARIEPNSALCITSGINPAWESSVTTFKHVTWDQLFPGKDSVGEDDWRKVSETFGAYAQWMSEKEGSLVEPLGLARVRGNN